MTFTAADKLKTIERELAMRKHVYPRQIAAGKMTDGFAAVQIAIMEAIASDYRAIVENEKLP